MSQIKERLNTNNLMERLKKKQLDWINELIQDIDPEYKGQTIEDARKWRKRIAN